MNYLLDTSLISDVVRKRPDPGVIAWMKQVDEWTCYLSVLTLGEIQKGVSRLPDSSRKTKLFHWLEHDLRVRFEGRILAITDDIALTWGKILGEAESKGNPVPVVDALIAATAVIHDLAVVTRNTSHLQSCGANTINPFGRGV